LPIPFNATNTVYVEGIPFDATEREVAHIFRPFPGFKSVRLIPREKKPGEKVIFCFADFDNKMQTTIVINTLQVRVYIDL
jgi:RNA recognition motif-containing protein